MSVVNGQLVQNKISAGSVAGFGQSLRTFVPEFQVCPPRGAFDYAGREAPADSIQTEMCPGGYPASLRIEVENSLRASVSPTFFNLPIGISGGADTMFGQMSTGRMNAFGYRDIIDLPVDVTQGGPGQKLAQQYGIGENDVLTQLASKYAGTQQVNPTYAQPTEESGYSYKGGFTGPNGEFVEYTNIPGVFLVDGFKMGSFNSNGEFVPYNPPAVDPKDRVLGPQMSEPFRHMRR